MAPFIKKRSNFLMWVFLPSLLLVGSIFGINLVSRPGLTGIGCSVVADCNSQDPNPCRLFQCLNGACIPAGIDTTQPACAICESCGNGICEPGSPAGDEIFNPSSAQGPTCSLDCGTTGVLLTRCAEDSFTGFPFPCSATRDFCCPSKCQGSNPSDSLTFDADCCQNICGDGLIDQPSETCDGSAVAPGKTPPSGGNTCRAPNTAGECTYCGDGNVDPGEQCEPPNTATCNANCQTITSQPVCGNGIVETGEQCEGTTCNITQSDGSVVPGVCQNCQCLPECVTEGSGCGNNGGTQAPCFSGTGGTGTGSSLIPLPVHSTVVAQWIGAFAVPGSIFTGLRFRRKRKK